jgi:Holliday junction DNA helicase RuvA
MIASLRGKFLYSDQTSVVIECAGVGYKCFVTKNTLYNLPSAGDEMFLYTHLAVREDAMDLYGFADLEELNAFKLITSVNGVGAKIGIAILSEFTASQLILAIAGNDAKTLTAAAGVGIKLAQRIVLELKDKVGNAVVGESMNVAAVSKAVANTSTAEAIEALVALGYSKSEASLAVGRLDGSLSTDELIKQALKVLARRL